MANEISGEATHELTEPQRIALNLIVSSRWAWSRVDGLLRESGVDQDVLDSLVDSGWAVYWILPRANVITLTPWGADRALQEIVEDGHAGRPRWATAGGYRRPVVIRPLANTVQLQHPDFVVDRKTVPRSTATEYMMEVGTGERTTDAKSAICLTSQNIPIEIDRKRNRKVSKKKRRKGAMGKQQAQATGDQPQGDAEAKAERKKGKGKRKGKGKGKKRGKASDNGGAGGTSAPDGGKHEGDSGRPAA